MKGFFIGLAYVVGILVGCTVVALGIGFGILGIAELLERAGTVNWDSVAYSIWLWESASTNIWEWAHSIGWACYLVSVAGFFGILALLIRKIDGFWFCLFTALSAQAVGWLLIKIPDLTGAQAGEFLFATPILGMGVIFWSSYAIAYIINTEVADARIPSR